jgi:hypothetical protein
VINAQPGTKAQGKDGKIEQKTVMIHALSPAKLNLST